jgi:hypothetical protein
MGGAAYKLIFPAYGWCAKRILGLLLLGLDGDVLWELK